MSLTEKSSATTVVGLSAKVIIMSVAKARKPTKPTTAPTPDGSNKPWSVPPEEGDKYRALVALCHFKANGAQYRFMMTLIDRANPETGRCDPGTETLSKDAKAASRSINRARAFWREKAVISYRQRRNTSATYRINWDLLNRIFQQNYRDRRRTPLRCAAADQPHKPSRKHGQESWARETKA